METLTALLSAIALWATAIWLVLRIEAKQERKLEQELMRQTAMDFQELNAQIELSLSMLGSPQLEEKTRRQEIAMRLSTVLIEKLLLRHVPDCSPKQ